MFETASAVLMLIVFVVPGFVWRTVEGQFVYLDKRLEWEKLALGLLTRSTLVYLPWTPYLYHGWKAGWADKHPVSAMCAAFGLLLVLPSFLGFIVGAAR